MYLGQNLPFTPLAIFHLSFHGMFAACKWLNRLIERSTHSLQALLSKTFHCLHFCVSMKWGEGKVHGVTKRSIVASLAYHLYRMDSNWNFNKIRNNLNM